MARFSSAKGERTHRKILEATLEVIAHEGVRSVTHRRVAGQAEISMGLITYYFSSTEDLITGALEAVATRETATFDRLRAGVEALGQDADGIDAIVELFVEEVMERSGRLKVETTAMLALILELSDQRLDRDVFGPWEDSEFALCEAVMRQLGCEPDMDLTYFIASVLDGLFTSAVISPTPDVHLQRATRAGLRSLFEGLQSHALTEASQP